MDTIMLKINGQDIKAAPGRTILEVVREQELDDIPTLCHSPELDPFGSCFLCVVEVKGRPNLVPSCATRIAEGMEVVTRNERIEKSRRTALELLLSNHYADCVSPCREGCPAGVDVQGYIALAAMGESRRAADLIRERNPLPAVCGRVCVRKCEDVCRREDVDAPVAINNIKRFVTDGPEAYSTVPTCAPDTGKSVGIVGAGPAGLTAAWFLGRMGIRPVVYEAMEKTGGMLRYGIPEYRLPDEVLDREVEYITRAGAEIHLGVRVGRDVTLDALRERHDAVFIAAGAWTGKPMRVAGEFDTEGVVTGADFLPERAVDRTPLRGTVVVVGGGNTAMDAARTAWRLQADKVIILYRRTRAEMPADKAEISDCLEEGVEIMELAAPIGIVRENGKLQALRCIRMKLGEPDASGRRSPVTLEGSEFDLPCDLVISAIGQDTALDGLAVIETATGPAKLDLTKWGTYKVDTATMATGIPGVFAGGDAADDGPTVVIDAIRDGGIAARSIAAWLGVSEAPTAPFTVSKSFWSRPGKAELGDIEESPRHEVHLIEVDDRRGSFREVSEGFEPEDNEHECARCLSCGCVRFDDCELRLRAEEYGVDMERFKGHVRKHRVDDRHPHISYDPNKCVLCGRCIRTCARVLPVPALGLVGRGFRTEMRPSMNDPLVETSCVSCGNCVDACPTGALTVKYPFEGRACLPTEDVATHCGFCSVGCGTIVKSFGEGGYFVASTGIPGDYLCRFGRFGQELFVRSNRIRSATLRDGASRTTAGLCESAETTIRSLRRIAAEHGPGSIAVFVSPELTNEEMYLAGRLAREGLGTGNVGSLTLLAGGSRSGALDGILGFTASTSDRSCLDGADLIVCNNTAMESDHLVLAVDVIQAVKGGARLVVANSTLDTTDRLLASLAVDPMRGRASVFWKAVVRSLFDGGSVPAGTVEAMPGGAALLASLDMPLEESARLSGVSPEDIVETAGLLAGARRVVLIHGPDRAQDASPGDLEILADLALILNRTGARADILLPRLLANTAGMEVAGADPAFLPGRRPVVDGTCAPCGSEELRKVLEDGSLRGVLILGEDPMEHDRTAAWFAGVEFLAASDWTETETTRAADVVLPGSTFLETPGTRCNFEGSLLRFARAVRPPSGTDGIDVLAALAGAAGLTVPMAPGELFRELDRTVRGGLGDDVAFYWNTGETRDWRGGGTLTPIGTARRTVSIQPPLTRSQRYRSGIREVGTERYRVGGRD